MKHEDLYYPGHIRTFTGAYIDPLNPDPAKIQIEDIAHALSMQPRFGGHLPVFYSVAQHSLRVSRLVTDPAQQLAALMHDAAEAYLIDVPSPVKQRLTGYREIEDNLMRMIAEKFGFAWPLHPCVKAADEQALRTEWESLMLRRGFWVLDSDYPLRAKILFMERFAELIPINPLNHENFK